MATYSPWLFVYLMLKVEPLFAFAYRVDSTLVDGMVKLLPELEVQRQEEGLSKSKVDQEPNQGSAGPKGS